MQIAVASCDQLPIVSGSLIRYRFDMQENSSPAVFLKQVLQDRIRRNAHYSLRAFARDLDISHNYLSQILNERRPLSVKRAVRMAKRFSQAESANLIRLTAQRQVAMEEGLVTKPSPARPKTREDFIAELDQFRFVSQWYHGAILELTSTKNFRPHYGWIGRRLHLTEVQVRKAVARLRRLGFLKVSRARWTRTSPHVFFPTTEANRAVKLFHAQMLNKAVGELDSEAFAGRDITGITCAIDPSRLPEARKKIAAFRRALMGFLTKGAPSEVYQISLQLFPLSHGVSHEK